MPLTQGEALERHLHETTIKWYDECRRKNAKLHQQLRAALCLLSASTRTAMRAHEMARKCPALADLMHGVLQGKIADQASAQEAIVVITNFAQENAIDMARLSRQVGAAGRRCERRPPLPPHEKQ